MECVHSIVHEPGINQYVYRVCTAQAGPRTLPTHPACMAPAAMCLLLLLCLYYVGFYYVRTPSGTSGTPSDT